MGQPEERRFLSPGRHVLVRGATWTVIAHTSHGDCASLRVSGSDAKNAGITRTFLVPFDRPEQSHPLLRLARRRRWVHDVRRLLVTCHPLGSVPTVAAATVDLLPFQLEPALAMLRHGCLRVLIADDVGLGKTVQAGMILAQLEASDTELRALVVTPAGVRAQWRAELRSRFGLGSRLADAAWLAETARSLPQDVNPWSLPGIFVTSIDLVKRPEVLRALEDVRWDAVVIDEAHHLGAVTARLEAAHALARRARRVILLTATPPYGEPAHMDALTAVGRLGDDDHVTIFRRTRDTAGVARRRKSVLLAVRLSAAERRMHRALDHYTVAVWRACSRRADTRGRLATIVLRKRALSSARSLARSVRRRLALLGGDQPADGWQLTLPLDDEDPLADAVPDAVLGAEGLSDVANEREWLERIARLADRASATESKLRLLGRLLRRVGEPAVVFTEYRDTLGHIASALADRAPLLLHGEMAPVEREAILRTFTTSGSLLLATDAASEGLNLHHRCRVVVHFELPWTPMRLEQRAGRVDRLGQRRPVHEVLLVARHTAERLVLAPLITRARHAAAAGDQARAAAFTEARVAEMIMNGAVAPAVEATVPPPPPVIRLLHEGEAEARRLAACRRLTHPAMRSHSSGGVPLAVTIGAASHTSVVLRISLETGDGRVLATELLPASLDLCLRTTAGTPIDPRALASELLHLHLGAIESAVERHLQTTRPGWKAEAVAVQDALARREAAMAGGLPSAARRLVQIGLFDRRAIGEAARRERVVSSLDADTTERLARLDVDRPLLTRVALAAIYVGRRIFT